MSISEFVEKKPSLGEILNFVEQEAQRIASERRKAAGQAPVGRKT
jgi:hypothetical protein